MSQSPCQEADVLISLICHNLAITGITDLIFSRRSRKSHRECDSWPISGKDKLETKSVVLCGLYFLKWENLTVCNPVSSIHLEKENAFIIPRTVVSFDRGSVVMITDAEYVGLNSVQRQWGALNSFGLPKARFSLVSGICEGWKQGYRESGCWASLSKVAGRVNPLFPSQSRGVGWEQEQQCCLLGWCLVALDLLSGSHTHPWYSSPEEN